MKLVKIGIWTVLFSMLFSGSVNILSVYAQEDGFTDTFDKSNLPGWEHSETATVSKSLLHLESGGFAFKPGNWADFLLTLQVRYFNKETFIIEYRVTDEGAYRLEFSENLMTLKRRVGQESAPLGKAETVKFDGTRIEISIETEGGLHKISVNNKSMITVQEKDAQPAGGILLRVDGNLRAEIDEISLSPLTAESVPEKLTDEIPADSIPAYLQETWLRMGGPPGGLGYDIRMRPDNPDIMFVTDANAGIHKSVDGGLTWEAKNEGIQLFLTGGAPVFCATIDPHDYDTVWIGTQGLGHVFMSTDNGETWEARDKGIEYEGRSIRGITIDPNNPDIVYIGLEVASIIWNGEPIIKRFDLTQGEVYKSTDRGKSWKRIWVGDNLARYIWVDPRDSNKLFVSTGIFDRDAANSDVPNGEWGGVGIVRSEDGGQTWMILDENHGLGGRYIPSLFMHPDNPDILLAGVTNTSDVPGAYLTRDGGDSWKLVLETPPGFGAQAVEIAESDTNVWYVGAEGLIWRSDDAGKEWQQFEVGAGERRSGLPIDLQVDPRDPMRIFVNNYGGGNFLSEDGGETWVDASHGYTGIGNLENIHVTSQNDALVFAGSFRSEDGGETWNGINFAFGDSIVIKQENEGEILLAGDTSGNVRQSKDGGISWSEPTKVVDIPAGLKDGSLDLESYPLVAMANSPSDPDMIYSGFTHSYCLARFWYKCLYKTPGLYRSENGGLNWKHLEIPPGDISVLGIAVDPENSQHVFIGTGDGFYETVDSGQDWTRNAALDKLTESIYIHPELAQEGMQTSMILDVRIDPYDAQTLYVSSTPGGVYRSQDGGKTWKHIPSGMDPNEIIHKILPDPNRKGVVYASSSFSGVFVSENHGDTWKNISETLEFKTIRGISLSADGSVLYAGAEGGGVFRLGDPKNLSE